MVHLEDRTGRAKLHVPLGMKLSKLQTWRDGHGHQFLEQQFACIWHEDLHNRAILACRTMKLILLQVGNRYHATLLADMYPVCI